MKVMPDYYFYTFADIPCLFQIHMWLDFGILINPRMRKGLLLFIFRKRKNYYFLGWAAIISFPL
jgi:hypothetical protein